MPRGARLLHVTSFLVVRPVIFLLEWHSCWLDPGIPHDGSSRVRKAASVHLIHPAQLLEQNVHLQTKNQGISDGRNRTRTNEVFQLGLSGNTSVDWKAIVSFQYHPVILDTEWVRWLQPELLFKAFSLA